MTQTTVETETFFSCTLPVGPLQCNCTIVGDKESKEAIVIDPGGDADVILSILREQNFTLKTILHTHAHFDHFLASGDLREATGAPLALHKADRYLWDNLKMQCDLYALPFKEVPPPDAIIQHEEEFFAGKCKCQAIHTPGHTPGSTSFYFGEHKLLVAGDTLFHRSVGRTDLWGGDYDTMERSIKNRLYTLDETATVVTGHGRNTTLGDEMRYNPYITANKKSR